MALSDNLLVYYKMDEDSWNGTADEIKDSSGNGQDGVAVNAVISDSGLINNCGSRASGSGCLNFGTVAGMGSWTAFTFSFWIKTSANGIIAAPDNADTVFNIGLHNWANAGLEAYVFFTSGGWTYCGNALTPEANDGNYHHCVIRYDGLNIETWQDGTKYGTAAAAGKTTGNQIGDFTIGGRGQSSGWLGLVDEWAIWTRGITDQEIADLFNSGAGLEITFPIPAPDPTTNHLKFYRRTRFPGDITGD